MRTCDVFAALSLQLFFLSPFLSSCDKSTVTQPPSLHQLRQVYTVTVRAQCGHSYSKYIILPRKDRGGECSGKKVFLSGLSFLSERDIF